MRCRRDCCAAGRHGAHNLHWRAQQDPPAAGARVRSPQRPGAAVQAQWARAAARRLALADAHAARCRRSHSWSGAALRPPWQATQHAGMASAASSVHARSGSGPCWYTDDQFFLVLLRQCSCPLLECYIVKRVTQSLLCVELCVWAAATSVCVPFACGDSVTAVLAGAPVCSWLRRAAALRQRRACLHARCCSACLASRTRAASEQAFRRYNNTTSGA
jgi:hypothetical protein